MAADILIDRIMDSARARLPGAIDNNIYFELAYALDDFFRRSQCWREQIEVPVTDAYLSYELDSVDIPSRVIALYGFTDGNNIPFGASLASSNNLTLFRQYAPGTYYAWVALTVGLRLNNDLYPQFPQWVSDRYGDTIADCIVGRLMAMPAKPFSSPTHAQYFMRKFRQGAQEARIESNRQNVVGGQMWRFPGFAAQRR